MVDALEPDGRRTWSSSAGWSSGTTRRPSRPWPTYLLADWDGGRPAVHQGAAARLRPGARGPGAGRVGGPRRGDADRPHDGSGEGLAMADPKGFMTTPRRVAERRPVAERIHDWQEVYPGYAGAGRAADHLRAGRSVHGLRHPVLPHRLSAGQPDPGVERPGLAQRLGRGAGAAARHQQLPGVHRAALPGAVRDRLRGRDQPGPGDDQERRGRDHRQGLGRAPGHAAAAGVAHRQDRRGGRIGTGRTGRRPSS